MFKKNEGEKFVKGIVSFLKTASCYEIQYEGGEFAKLTILNNHVFRYYMSPTGEFLEYPIPNNPNDKAKINSKNVIDYDTEAFDDSTLTCDGKNYIVNTEEIIIRFHVLKGTFDVYDKRVMKQVLTEQDPIRYSDELTAQTLFQSDTEFFFGGGMQNGRFTHKGEIIHIENTNNWVDGGVTSPSPFYWSSFGYGILRNTWKPGFYDFGCDNPDIIITAHKENHIDAFYFINPKPRHILNDYYELTGQPIFLPEYAFYEAHLNTFNRDFWVEVPPEMKGAIKFEDGKFYKKYKPNEMDNKHGILESLNGEKNNYQFSARAMIDRYNKHDVPLGWFIPNDGYGSGYGQTDTLQGDIENLKKFIEYANQQGVEVALWTECNLEPKDPLHPKKGERDLKKEVGVGAVALKCDVAWIGDGYSFGLSAVEHATNIYVGSAKKDRRPLIIMVDGWAGTQRYAGIWSGDQTGGQWEYIRFHIPTYIGAGLSGLPIVGSDMYGIYGGGVKEVNVRDFQWKTFTPLQLNMDGWGNTPKTPFSFDSEALNINRAYLKLKAMMLPYNYTIAQQSIHGLPMVRAMFLEFPMEEAAYTKDSQYQFMWGPSLLVAPVYNDGKLKDNTSIRHGIYLPDQNQVWLDIFTEQKYQGGKIYNNINTPLWKIPVFVREGAIIPYVNENNNVYEIKRDYRIIDIYPNDAMTEFEIYEDDGRSLEYLDHQYAMTKISVHNVKSLETNNLFVNIHKTKGQYKNMIKPRKTLVRIKTAKDIETIKAAISGKSINMNKAKTKEEFEELLNGYYYDDRFLIHKQFEEFNYCGDLFQKFLLVKIERTDITEAEIQLKLNDYTNKNIEDRILGNNNNIDPKLEIPRDFGVMENGITSTSIILKWTETNVSFYEVERDGTVFTNILGDSFKFSHFRSESEHKFRIRSASHEGVSEWSYYISVQTGPDPYKNAVKGVSVTCNIPCQPYQQVCKLTEKDMNSVWHTHWGMPDQADVDKGNMIILSFNLEHVYDIDKIEYIPREDAGNGTFLKIRYRYSEDGEHWSEVSPEIDLERDTTTKTIVLNAKMQFFELNILKSVGGFGSGRNVIFYKHV